MRGPGPESVKITAYRIALFYVNAVHSLNSQHHSREGIVCGYDGHYGKEKEACRGRGRRVAPAGGRGKEKKARTRGRSHSNDDPNNTRNIRESLTWDNGLDKSSGQGT